MNRGSDHKVIHVPCTPTNVKLLSTSCGQALTGLHMAFLSIGRVGEWHQLLCCLAQIDFFAWDLANDFGIGIAFSFFSGETQDSIHRLRDLVHSLARSGLATHLKIHN